MVEERRAAPEGELWAMIEGGVLSGVAHPFNLRLVGLRGAGEVAALRNLPMI